MASLYLVDIEQHALGLLLSNPEVWPDINFVTRDEFAEVRQHLFDVIKQQLDANASVTPIIVAEKLKSYGQSGTEIGGVDTLVYLEGLQRRGRMIEKKDALALAKELKKATVKRQLIAACKKAAIKIESEDSIDGMVNVVDTTLSAVSTELFRPQTTLMFDGFISDMEERRLNPIDSDKMGYQGPFPSMNSTIGATTFASSFCVVGARTGGQKSALGFYYNTWLVEKYGLVCLHLDCNEMPRKQILDRSAACLSKGQLPLWAIKSGEWGMKEEWVKVWRNEVVPRINKVAPLIHYQNIGRMQPKDVVAFIKRFYFKHVGRGNHLLVNLDYIKGASSFRGGRDQEHQVVGDYVDWLKDLITNEITASIWTSVQLNRGGIVTGKKLDDISDSEGNYALSDRIIQQATDGFSMRFKVPEELAREKNLFGNIRLDHHKGRDLVGKQYQAALRPVKTPQGKFLKNYYNLNSHGFFFEDKGDLNTMLRTLGHTAIDLSTKMGDEQMP